VSVHVITVDQLNAYDVLVNDEVVFTSAALQVYLDRGSAATRPDPVEGHDDALRQTQVASETESQGASEAESQGAAETEAPGTAEAPEEDLK
jgi:large subunit ribosomal protein L4